MVKRYVSPEEALKIAIHANDEKREEERLISVPRPCCYCGRDLRTDSIDAIKRGSCGNCYSEYIGTYLPLRNKFG